MVRPGLRKNMEGVPEICLSWMKQRSGRISREHLHREDSPRLRNPVPEMSEEGPSTRVFDQARERKREREKMMTQGMAAQGNSPREDLVNQPVVGELQEAH
jgi:hypothetical protein